MGAKFKPGSTVWKTDGRSVVIVATYPETDDAEAQYDVLYEDGTPNRELESQFTSSPPD